MGEDDDLLGTVGVDGDDESSQLTCLRCGGTQFRETDGHLFCRNCGLQALATSAQDEDYMEQMRGGAGGRLQHIHRRQEESELQDRQHRLAQRFTYYDALRKALEELLDAMTRQKENGGTICVPDEIKEVAHKLWDSWVQQQFVFQHEDTDDDDDTGSPFC